MNQEISVIRFDYDCKNGLYFIGGSVFKKASLALTILSGIMLSSFSLAQTEQVESKMSSFPELNEEVEMFNGAGGLDKNFLPAKEAFKHNLWVEGDTLYLGFDIEEDYYLYRDKTEILSRDDAYTLGEIKVPKGKEIEDEFFGEVFIYENYAIMSADIITEKKEIQELPISITFQGCSKAGLCYPPENIIADVRRFTPPSHLMDAYNEFLSSNSNLLQEEIKDFATEKDLSLENDKVSDSSYLGIALTFFLIGVGLSFTPCVLPMLPILSSIIVGKDRTQKEAFLISSSYSLGVVIVYTLFGLLVGVVGSGLNVQAYLQSPYIVIPMALIFVVFSLIMFGKINLSSILKTNGKLGAKISDTQEEVSKSGMFGSMIAGMLSVLVLSPCVSAPLAGVLVYISTTGDILVGGVSLASMALGMSLLLIIAGTFGASKLPRSGMWMQHIKNIFGFTLIAMAVWVTGYLVSKEVYHLLMSVIGFMVGVELWKLSEIKNKSFISSILKSLAFILFSFSLVFSTSAIERTLLINEKSVVEFSNYGSFVDNNTVNDLKKEDMQEIVSKDRYIVYFGADWCVSCRKMERDIFSNSQYIKSLEERDINFIKIDVTKNTDDNKAIMSEYNIFGPPALLIFENNDLLEVKQGEITLKDANEITNTYF
jgi:thiol:disulfide interchange protein DsbD